jgi:hypothetical protein
MKVLAIILAILAFLVCLVIGIQAGSSWSRQSQAGNNSAASSLPAGTQRTVLLIQADDLTSANPRLIHLYFLLYLPQHTAFTYVAVYPDAGSRFSKEAAKLEQAFSITEDGTPSHAFLDALRTYQLTWNGYILVDESGTTSLLDYIFRGGSDQIQRATQSALTAEQQDPEGLVADICDHLNSSSHSIDWNQAFSKLIPDHLHTDLGYEMIMADWKAMLAANETFTCKLIRP